MPPVIKAVCFDFDGTLAHFAGSFAELVDGLRRDLGLTPKDAERLALVRAQAERRGGPMTFADTVRAALIELEFPVPDNLETLGDYLLQPDGAGRTHAQRADGARLLRLRRRLVARRGRVGSLVAALAPRRAPA